MCGLVVNHGQILDRPRGRGPAGEWHHKTVEVSAHVVVPVDAESNVVGVNDAGWSASHRIRAAAEVGEVREPGMIWESQIKHEFRRDRSRSAGVDKNLNIRRIGDLEVNQYPSDITRVLVFEIQMLQTTEVDDTSSWGEGGSVGGQPRTSVCHREHGELRA